MFKIFEGDLFREWFYLKVSENPKSFSSYKWYLDRVDKALEGGLDAAFDLQGAEHLIRWAKSTSGPPFDRHPSHLRSALKRYIEFRLDQELPIEEDGEVPTASEPEVISTFRIEQQMQAAVREQISALEPGLAAADDGAELVVSTGRVDILARDLQQRLVVIELKAGRCPSSALEQALGYAQAIQDEQGENPRIIIIASEFSARTRAAAKRIPDLRLMTYQFSLKFQPV